MAEKLNTVKLSHDWIRNGKTVKAETTLTDVTDSELACLQSVAKRKDEVTTKKEPSPSP